MPWVGFVEPYNNMEDKQMILNEIQVLTSVISAFNLVGKTADIDLITSKIIDLVKKL